MIIRIQTEYGMKRVDVNPSDATEELYEKVKKRKTIRRNKFLGKWLLFPFELLF